MSNLNVSWLSMFLGSSLKQAICGVCLIALLSSHALAAGNDQPAEFVAAANEPGFQTPDIVLFHDPASGAGVDWEAVKDPRWFHDKPPVMLGRGASYLRDGLQSMTGLDYSIVSRSDLSTGIVMVLLDDAPSDIAANAGVFDALRQDPDDPYAANEAFYIYSESQRVVLVANTIDGLLNASVDLLESVGYEQLAMGPNWAHVPDYHNRPLVFALRRASRPSFYIRALQAGHGYGAATITSGLTDPADETVDVSIWRWWIGSRMAGTSMPPFPGHKLQTYHPQVAAHMAKTGQTQGILAPQTRVGPFADRPAPSAENKGWIWVTTDASPEGDSGQRYLSQDTAWLHLPPGRCGWNLDLSVDFVRQIIFQDMIKEATTAFENNPDDLVIFGMDAEDGAPGSAFLKERTHDPDWYPQYLKEKNLPFNRPYVLHGFKGLDQPKESWDPTAASDHMFGLATWLLHEFDAWVDSLPQDQQKTATGRDKKELIRCSFYSYNFHDVPPTFNPDQRIRVQIAGYPKHRGIGKWGPLATHEDVAKAFNVMLPGEPSGDYKVYSLAYYRDRGATGIPPVRSSLAAHIAEKFNRSYDVGFRVMRMETDLNFGKYGLSYYLSLKMLWDASMTTEQLDALRDQWFHRAFGSGWQEMKAYYDFMSPENYPVNGPNSWAQAIRMIDAADQKVDPAAEPDAQQRIDEVKQYWYAHYLVDSKKFSKTAPELLEYLWKGQMSYMVAMHATVKELYNTRKIASVVPPEIRSGPAHYDHEETQQWWAKVLDHWQLTPVSQFKQAKLSNGKPAASVDLNDMVAVKQFQNDKTDVVFYFDSYSAAETTAIMVAPSAGAPLGFTLTWPSKPGNMHYAERQVNYLVDKWDPDAKAWTTWTDATMNVQTSEEVQDAAGNMIHVINVRLEAPSAGTFRIDIGNGGMVAKLAGPTYDAINNKFAGTLGFTYCTNALGYTQGPAYFYIPKGTRSLDMEVWDHRKGRFIQLYNGLPSGELKPTRKIDVSAMQTHTIALEPGEDGTLASVTGNLFAFPYLYSVPTFWAMSPAALLVPRDIAEADGLTAISHSPKH